MLGRGDVPFAARDLFRRPLSLDELRALATKASPTALFSWKSPTARARGLAPGGLADDDLLRLMAEEPRLVRRPLILFGDEIIVGVDRARLEAALSHHAG